MIWGGAALYLWASLSIWPPLPSTSGAALNFWASLSLWPPLFSTSGSALSARASPNHWPTKDCKFPRQEGLFPYFFFFFGIGFFVTGRREVRWGLAIPLYPAITSPNFLFW